MAIEKEVKLSFTVGEQTKIDRWMDDAFARGFKKAERQAQIEIDKLRHEIERLKIPWWRR